MRFDYAKSFSAPTEVLTQPVFTALIYSERLTEDCRRIQAAIGTKEYAQLKRRLPVVMWQSHFADGKRHDASAEPSGLYMLDIDHLEPIRMEEIRNAALAKGPDTLGIYIIHKTPSEQGLRFVAKMLASNSGLSTITEHQLWLAEQLGLKPEEVDTACKDWARASFLPSQNYFYYINQAIFADEAEMTLNPTNNHEKSKLDSCSGGDSQSSSADCEPCEAQEATITEYKGVSLRSIAVEYFERTGGQPVEGERHQRFLDAARVLRYICDFKASNIFAALAPLYDDHEDLRRVCVDSTRMAQGSQKPKILTEILRDMINKGDEDARKPIPAPTLPQSLPPIFREYVTVAPADFKEVSYISLLPVLGTVFSHLRASYLDGKTKTPSFMAVIEAPQASGKSFLEQIVEQMLVHVYAEDDISWGLWRKYMQDRKANKNKEEQPEEPDAPIRIIPATISITQYLVRQTHCPERHLFSFIPEIATLTRTNSAGAWSQKSELYRLAFDNAKFGQDYASDNSFSGVVRVFYNWLASGTPMDVGRFFKNCEDGLVSRVLFAKLPDQLGAVMPKWGILSSADLSRMQKIVKTSGCEKELRYDLGYVNDALAEWLETKRMMVLKTGDRALDVFRRRAAQIGFQAALIFHHLYLLSSNAKVKKVSKAQQATIVKNALYVAEAALFGQYEKFAEPLNEIDATQYAKQQNPRWTNILDTLPKKFSKADLESELRINQKKTPARNVISLWTRNKLIKKLEKDSYEKL